MPFNFPSLHRVNPNSKVSLASIDPGATPGVETQGKDKKAKDKLKDQANEATAQHVADIAKLQEVMYAENKTGLLVVLQGMDTSGKDGVVRNVFSGVNPQGCHVTSFKKPSEAEADRDFLWRIHAEVPARGEIHVFNRAHYEDVLIVRVHNFVPEPVWRKRYEMINQFEQYLTENHVVVLKFMLHISKDEQKERLQARLDDPAKQWKFNPTDVEERKYWSDYQKAYEAVLEKCSTEYAPWYVIPSNKKWYRNWAVSKIVRDTLQEIKPKAPRPTYDPKKYVIV
ncbi:MAG: polyphosphate kinase 2 family protein [Phycisphaerales bacterium]